MVRERGGDGGRSVRLAELAAACQRRGVPTAHLGTWHAETGTFDPASGQGASFPDYTFGTHAAEVEVDLETGEVRVLKYAAAHDVGRAINPLRVEGQIQGGAAQGLGYALDEEVVVEEGQTMSTAVRQLPHAQLGRPARRAGDHRRERRGQGPVRCQGDRRTDRSATRRRPSPTR